MFRTWFLVLSGLAGPSCMFWCLKICLRHTFTVYFWNNPLSPKICTGAVLLRFLYNLCVKTFGYIPKISYKVIQYQQWWWHKLTNILNVCTIILDIRVRKEMWFNQQSYILDHKLRSYIFTTVIQFSISEKIYWF